ncbi:MAG: hypothetical protein HYY84_01695 [Deltaproteobacteria bacterium]|nr:hypothetical protein [Deltaproteobacteria bacterium]
MESLIREIPGVDVSTVCVDAPYEGGGSQKGPVGAAIRLKSVYNGKGKIFRLFSSLIEGRRLIKKALELGDVIVAMTAPPFLNYWAGRLCKAARVPWVYWSMDVYPDAFSAARLVREGNPVYRYLLKSFRQNPPDLLVALGEEQASFLQRRWAAPVPQVVLPCGVFTDHFSATQPKWRQDDRKIYFGYVGNLGEAHDPEFVVDFVNLLDAKLHQFILSVYGSKAQRVVERLKGHPAVKLVDAVSRSELQFIDIHLVSLSPEWTHVCVPSKAVSAICAGQIILFNGLESSDAWRMLGEAGFLVSECSKREARRAQMSAVVSSLSNGGVLRQRKDNALRIHDRLIRLEDNSFKSIAARIKNWVFQPQTNLA